jgi:hypothetical protein
VVFPVCGVTAATGSGSGIVLGAAFSATLHAIEIQKIANEKTMARIFNISYGLR